MLEDLPDDWIVGLSQDWLNPREQRRLASCNRRHQRLLPQPLRIQICSRRHMSAAASSAASDSCCCLGGDLFVSRVLFFESSGDEVPSKEENNGSTDGIDPYQILPRIKASPSASTSNNPYDRMSPPLTAKEAAHAMQFNAPYYFWKFDYAQHCRVFLGRQLRQSAPRTDAGGRVGRGPEPEHPTTTSVTTAATTTTTTPPPSQPAPDRFTLAFRPHSPNQYWTIRLRSTNGSSTTTITNTATISAHLRNSLHHSTAVQPGRPIQLIVAGWNTRPGQVDSTEEHRLLAQVRPTHSGRPSWMWHAVPHKSKHPNSNDDNNAMDDDDEYDDDLSFAYTTSHGRRLRSKGDLFVLFPSCPNITPQDHGSRRRRRVKRRSSSSTTAGAAATPVATQVVPVETFCPPDISDGGSYLLYSPHRWNPRLTPSPTRFTTTTNSEEDDGWVPSYSVYPPTATNTGRCCLVDFSVRITHGILHFKAVSLPFALAIPIVEQDRPYLQQSRHHWNESTTTATRIIASLFESYSARWGCIKYYMATAADVDEGCALDMDQFLQRFTSHPDHRIERKPGVVSIIMVTRRRQHRQPQQNGQATTENDQDDDDDEDVSPRPHDVLSDTSLVPDIPQEDDDSQRWKFFFSW